jgi:hypothetical protein
MDRRSKLVILTSNLMRSIRIMETLIQWMSVFFAFKKLDFFGLGDMFELAPCLTR